MEGTEQIADIKVFYKMMKLFLLMYYNLNNESSIPRQQISHAGDYESILQSSEGCSQP